MDGKGGWFAWGVPACGTRPSRLTAAAALRSTLALSSLLPVMLRLKSGRPGILTMPPLPPSLPGPPRRRDFVVLGVRIVMLSCLVTPSSLLSNLLSSLSSSLSSLSLGARMVMLSCRVVPSSLSILITPSCLAPPPFLEPPSTRAASCLAAFSSLSSGLSSGVRGALTGISSSSLCQF